MSQPDKLTPDQQSQAMSEWGGPGSFRCCACEADSTTRAPGTIATRAGLHLGTCQPCARRLKLSPAYRRQTQARADAAAFRALWQRVADLVGVTGAALVAALSLSDDGAPPAGSATLRQADARLNLPAGSIESALLQVLGVGPKQ